ncbi:MAG: glucosamine-6-phosphate isomerase [Dehalococcoidia bacterium]|nr:glucosamine-6-phosphate isomerase [Dehalococcoidia bacterium]
MRPISKIAPGWWDYTTLDHKILDQAARLTAEDLLGLSRKGFSIKFYDTLEDFFLAQAMEYITAWKQASADKPAGICGPIGPSEQLPLVARLVNELEINLDHCHFWGMDEWVSDGKELEFDHPLSLAGADMRLCFNRIREDLRMPSKNIHFPKVDTRDYIESWDKAHCVIMQGGQGEVKHWAFNDPPRREGKYGDAPPSPKEFRKLTTRLVDLHPLSLIQNARTSGGGMIHNIPTQALTVGPVETWKADKVSIWHPGDDDNPFGIRLTTFMISKKITDAAVPMSLLADHPNLQFNFYRGGISTCEMLMQ